MSEAGSSPFRCSLDQEASPSPDSSALITVATEGGQVTLTGSVQTLGDRYVAGATAWGAAGATQIDNDLIIA